jgi:SH3-like domain-containing protein
MAAGYRLVLISALAVAGTGVLPVMAQLVPPVENAKFGAAGVVNASSVAVHSGPGENYYPTIRLDKGTTVTVVGVKFDWLKIVPPEGSFSFVAKQYIDKTGDSTGKVNGQNVNIRVGSSLTPLKVAIQSQLQQGETVEILGEVDEYYKIKPPAGAYLYINKQYVDATKMLGPTAEIVKQSATAPSPAGVETSGSVAPVTATTEGNPAPQGTGTETVPANRAADPNTATAEKLAAAPTSRPGSSAITAAMDAYSQAEKDFMAASQQPIDQQPIAQLTETYTALAGNEKLPSSMRTNAQIRLQSLGLRADAQAGVLAVRKSQEEAKQRSAALTAEHDQLEAKLASSRVLIYTAMGQLTTSSLKLGDTPVYRLVDPANGRTLVYIRGNDVTLPGMLNQFVGVKGDVVADPQLSVNIITPTSIESVDPTKINAAAAQIQPLSLKTAASPNDK